MDTKTKIKLVSVLVNDILPLVVLHPVKLELVWKNTDWNHELNSFEDRFYDRVLYYETSDEDVNKLEEIAEKIKSDVIREKWDYVVFPQKHLKIYSVQTGNTDNRGGGCGDCGFTEEDFIWETTNEEGITLKNIIEGVYRLKGSKYDYWYELFESLSLKKETDEMIEIEASFGYGS